MKLQPFELPAPSIGLESVFADQPREQDGLNIQITAVRLTFLGQASGGTFMRMPTSCGPATSLALTSHSGKTRRFKQELATPGCDPLVAVHLTKKRRGFTLAALLRAPRLGPALKAARLALPKSLRRGRGSLSVHVDGKRMKAGKPRRAVRPKLGAEARRIKIVWTGLRRAKGKKLGPTVVVPVTIRDARGKSATLRVRVRRG